MKKIVSRSFAEGETIEQFIDRLGLQPEDICSITCFKTEYLIIYKLFYWAEIEENNCVSTLQKIRELIDKHL